MKSKIKLIFEIIIASCAIISLILGIWGLKIANEANETAKRAISVSTNNFMQENRPYIDVHPEKFSNGLYMEFVEKGKQCEVNLKFKIENKGKGAATDILCPQAGKFSKEMLKKGDILKKFIPAPIISLAPGEHVFLKINQILEPQNVTVEEYLKGYKDGRYFLDLDFQIIYRSEINQDEIYSTESRHKIYKDKAMLENYKHIKIDDPTFVKDYNNLFNRMSEK